MDSSSQHHYAPLYLYRYTSLSINWEIQDVLLGVLEDYDFLRCLG